MGFSSGQLDTSACTAVHQEICPKSVVVGGSIVLSFQLRVSARLIGIVLVSCICAYGIADGQQLRVAIVGTDTSHAVAYTKLINAPDARAELSQMRVVAAYAGGSPDIAASRNRVAQFAQQLEQSGIELVDSIEAAVERADAVMLESVDGRVHLEQFRRLATGKPVFIDKPATASVADFLRIMAIAEKIHTPFFSASPLRFCPEVQRISASKKIGKMLGASTSTPFQTEPHHPDLFWYGIHGVEALATLLGPGCETVRRSDTDAGALVLGTWADGRQGAVWALATHQAVYSYTVFGESGVECVAGFSGYANLVHEIGKFFVSRKPPVGADQTLEILAIMEAADASLAAAGRPVAVADIIRRAREQVNSSSTGKR